MNHNGHHIKNGQKHQNIGQKDLKMAEKIKNEMMNRCQYSKYYQIFNIVDISSNGHSRHSSKKRKI